VFRLIRDLRGGHPDNFVGSQTAKYLPSAPQEGARFGYSLSFNQNNKAIVGAPYRDVDGLTDAGSAYYFEFRTDGLMMGHMHLLTAGDDARANDHFGQSVNIVRPADAELKMVVGAPNKAGGPAGNAFIFKPAEGSGWDITRLTASTVGESSETDLFGYDVITQGMVTIVSAPLTAGGQGKVYFLLIRPDEPDDGSIVLERDGSIVTDEDGIDTLFLPVLNLGAFYPSEVPRHDQGFGHSLGIGNPEKGLFISGPLGVAVDLLTYPLAYIYDVLTLPLMEYMEESPTRLGS
jgi:hypothetical protein